MTRQVITLDKIHKCHVIADGESAGWFGYEPLTAYEAGTLVFDGDNNMFWCSIVDISAEDAETPLEAPDKWAFVPFIQTF